MTGIAEGINCINVEKIAINEVTARIPYNDEGIQPIEEKIIENGPDAYFTKLPAKKIVENLVKEKIPSEVSYSAGTYACNQAFYYLMHKIKNENITGGFIHLPTTPNMVAQIKTKKYASMSLEIMIKAMDITLRLIT